MKTGAKKQLTATNRLAHYSATVLNTPAIALPAHVRQADFLRPLFSQWPGSAQLCNSLRVNAVSRLSSVLKYPAAPQQGGQLNDTIGAIMAKQKRTRAPSRFTVYHFIRRFTGPVHAYRLAFAGRAA